MKLLLLISLVVLPCALGEHLECYANVESRNVTTPKTFVHCMSGCGKADVDLPDGSYVIVRSCGEFFADISSLLLRTDLRALPQDAKNALSRMPSRNLHLCKHHLCNKSPSIISSSWCVISAIATAVIGMVHY